VNGTLQFVSVKLTVLLAAILCVTPNLFAQPPTVRLAMSGTLRKALERSGFDDGIRTNNAPDLDRKLTSSAFGTSTDTFVAGYYFQDELVDGQGLGPLHVSLFDRSRREWVYGQNVTADVEKLGLMAGGSVMGILVNPRIILLDTHFSPSAGFTVVLDRSLKVVTSLGGYGTRVTNEGLIWYFGDMVHFADTHQETLKIFDLDRRAEVEVFPGPKLSPVAEAYRRQIKTIYARLPANQHEDDFDRSIQFVVERSSTSFAFVAGYGSDYLDGTGVAHPTLTTIARCDRQQAGQWSCSEREIDQFAREIGADVSRDTGGGYDKRTLESLVKAALDRKQ
jgi:hypothetical protein